MLHRGARPTLVVDLWILNTAEAPARVAVIPTLKTDAVHNSLIQNLLLNGC